MASRIPERTSALVAFATGRMLRATALRFALTAVLPVRTGNDPIAAHFELGAAPGANGCNGHDATSIKAGWDAYISDSKSDSTSGNNSLDFNSCTTRIEARQHKTHLPSWS